MSDSEEMSRANKLSARQHVYRLGWQHNKWIVVLKTASGNVERDLPRIVERLRELHGEMAVTTFDHVEYLGRG